MENQTEINHFILMSLTDREELQNFLFALFLILYLATVLGNGTIVCVVVGERRLHTPMYFFLSNLSCLDICYSSVILPKMLSGFLLAHRRISFIGCITQLHFFHFLGSSEALLLAAMAYDRYVAICNPLHYPIIMCRHTYILLAAATWTMGFFHALMHTIMTSRLHFCGPNIIQHFFCDIKPLLRLACSRTLLNLSLLNIVTGLIVIIPFFLTLISYLYIIFFLLMKVQSHSGRWKAFSTCTSHLTVVGLLYVPVLFNYLPPSSGDSPQRDMIATLMYSVVTSVLNPLIYTLRNQEMKSAVRRTIGRLLLSLRM
ncbi:olfactory receptor 12D1-like [Hemicordylus capensis]|uniref:olfactory receptor 12D1-like n=1 Tax=Hemicordylus capensis TaxID=884348 RepID=UPI00230481E7|nr:olfactory receptor 12D1-like [Hemicordylus capensis]